MERNEILFLSQEDVIRAGALDMSVAVPAMETLFSLHAKHEVVLPNKEVLRWGGAESESTRGRINSMPGYVGGDVNMAGIKWIASAPQNPFRFGLPRASALVVLNDPETLVPIAVMEGAAISASRTGANTGVAAKYLARENSRTLGLIGAGVQNRTQLLATLHVRPGIDDIRVYDINVDRARNFAQEMSGKVEQGIRVSSSAAEAIDNADIYITATVTKEPIITRDMVRPGVFYSHVGSHECTFDAIKEFDVHVVDDWVQLKHRGVESIAIMFAEGLIDDSFIDAELGQIVNGEKPGRRGNDEAIYFATVGMGIEDIALAAAVYRRAVAMGIGQKLRLYDMPFAI